jgi:hypothetical protein
VGVRFLLGGGFAVNAHGYARGTEDVDLIVADADRRRADEALCAAGFQRFKQAEVVNRYAPPAGMRFVVDVLPVEDATFGSLWEGSVVRSLQGRETRIPGLDHLLAMKVHAMKHDKMLRGLKDLLDIAQLARVNDLDPNGARLRDICLRFGNAQILDSIRKALEDT